MKYQIQLPARCPRHYRHLMGKRRGHCPLVYGHSGEHQFPMDGYNRAPSFRRMMARINPRHDRPF